MSTTFCACILILKRNLQIQVLSSALSSYQPSTIALWWLTGKLLVCQAVVDTEDVEELRSRIRELETEQRLIQRELDSVSAAAQRAETQLRSETDPT